MNKSDQLILENEDEMQEEKTIEEFLQDLGFGKAHLLLWSFFFLIPILKMSQLYLVLIIIPYLRCEWDLGTGFEAAIGSISHIVRAFTGAPLGGLADKFGRKRVLITAIFMFIVSGLCLATAPGKWTFLAARVLQGCAIGLCSHIPFVYVAEIASSEFKEIAVLAMAVSTHFGCVWVSVLSYLLLNTAGWRNMILIVTAPLFVVAAGLLCIPETPRYALVSSGKGKALKSLRNLYRLNGKVLPPDSLIECSTATGKVETRGKTFLVKG